MDSGRRFIIERAIASFDLDAYLANKDPVRAQTGEWLLVCPTCGKRKLSVRPTKKSYHCFVCEQYGAASYLTGRRIPLRGAGGLLDLISLLEGWPRYAAAQFVLEKAVWSPDSIERIEMELNAQPMPNPERGTPAHAKEISFPEFSRPIESPLPYMIQRGISMDDARAFGLFYCVGGRYQDRLIFPVWEDTRLVYFQGRAMWSEADRPGERYTKALNPPRAEGSAVSSEVLFNLDQARFFERVAICEGPIDAVHVGPSAVCTFGKRISAAQVAKLLARGVTGIDLMWDGPSVTEPNGAWLEMLDVAPTLGALFDLRLVFLPKNDPGSYTREDLDHFRAKGEKFEKSSKVTRI